MYLVSNRAFGLSILLGGIIAMLWSYHFVDSVIGDTVANGLLGYDAKQAPLHGYLSTAFFALVTGLAGTFTACNICAISCVGPVANGATTLSEAAKPVGKLLFGALTVSVLYGFFAVIFAAYLPQYTNETYFGFYQGRLLQASLIFVPIGILMLSWGWNGKVPSPFVLGAMIGAFLIGRPFPLFRKMFESAVETHNPFFGAGTFALQALGNIALIVLFIFLVSISGHRVRRWLHLNSVKIASIGFLIGGMFLVVYWGIRIPLRFWLAA